MVVRMYYQEGRFTTHFYEWSEQQGMKLIDTES